MNSLVALALTALAIAIPANAQSVLLESVKRNPEDALALCQKFRDLNSEGISASSAEALEIISKQRNLSKIDAEILSMYVIGLNCPDIH